MKVKHVHTGEVQEVLEEKEEGYLFDDGRIHDKSVWAALAPDPEPSTGGDVGEPADDGLVPGDDAAEVEKTHTKRKARRGTADDSGADYSLYKGE